MPNLYLSLLDRLIDNDPSQTVESSSQRNITFREIKKSVIRDIENLLNSKRNITPVPNACPEVKQSVFTYGLKDYSADSPNSAFFRTTLLKDIRNTLTQFEPRLKNTVITFETTSGKVRTINFRISGILVVDPIKEAVVFDTNFNANRGEYTIDR